MKKIIIIIICLLCLFTSFQFLTGCKQEKMDTTDIKKWKIVIEDPLATPNRVETDAFSTNDYTFTYSYDGKEHMPEVFIYIGDELCPFEYSYGRSIYDEIRKTWDLTPYAKDRGNYILSINIYDSEQKDEFLSGFSIDVIIK